MNRKEAFLLSLLLVITLGLTAGAIYQAQHRQNVRDAAVIKAQAAEKKAKADAAAYKLNLTAANSQVQLVTGLKVQACNDLAAHKLVEPACK